MKRNRDDMRKFILKVLCGICLVQAGFSNEMMTIQGKLTSITSDQYVVETPQFTYYVKKSFVPKPITDKIDKADVEISIAVPMAAIARVKSHIAKQ